MDESKEKKSTQWNATPQRPTKQVGGLIDTQGGLGNGYPEKVGKKSAPRKKAKRIQE